MSAQEVSGSDSEATREAKILEKKYQNKYAELRKGLEGKANRVIAQLKGLADHLPAHLQDLTPELLILGISPYGNLFCTASDAFKEDEHLQALVDLISQATVAFYQKKRSASSAAALVGQPSTANNSSGSASGRKKGEFQQLQACVSKHWRVLLARVQLIIEQEVGRKIQGMEVQPSAAERKGLLEDTKRRGYQPHEAKEVCLNGCEACKHFRAAIDWPGEMTLLNIAASRSREQLEQLAAHYKLSADRNSADSGGESMPAARSQARSRSVRRSDSVSGSDEEATGAPLPRHQHGSRQQPSRLRQTTYAGEPPNEGVSAHIQSSMAADMNRMLLIEQRQREQTGPAILPILEGPRAGLAALLPQLPPTLPQSQLAGPQFVVVSTQLQPVETQLQMVASQPLPAEPQLQQAEPRPLPLPVAPPTVTTDQQRGRRKRLPDTREIQPRTGGRAKKAVNYASLHLGETDDI